MLVIANQYFSKVRSVLHSLRLTKRHSVVYCDVNPINAGRIFKVKELVSVSTVKQKLAAGQEKKSLASSSGFTVIHRYNNGLKELNNMFES